LPFDSEKDLLPVSLAAFVKPERARWSRVLKAVGIKIE
jgi:hypothetical protein